MKMGYKIVALCISEIHNDDIIQMLYPLNRYLNQHGWKLIVFNTCTDLYEQSSFDQGEAGVFHLLNFDYLDAVIIYPRKIYDMEILQRVVDDAREHRKPVIMVQSEKSWLGTISLDFDEEAAFRELITHLIKDHGFSRIHCIAGFRGNDISEKRIQIFKDTLAENGINFDAATGLDYGDFYDVPTEAVVKRWIAEGNLPEAIVCINDMMAVTACRVFREHGIRVPEDIVVTGFDGSMQERYNYPRISTCRRDLEAFAQYTYEVLEEGYRNISLPVSGQSRSGWHRRFIFPYSFTPAGSCGCKEPSMDSISEDFSFLYAMGEDDNQYLRSLNNMTAWLNNTGDIQEIRKLIKTYIPADAFFCLNEDFHERYPVIHTKEDPFDQRMGAVRYFRKEDSIQEVKFQTTELIPEWDTFLQGDFPLIVASIHNQNQIYGYMAAFAETDTYKDFALGTKRLHRFMMNIDNSISMHVQRRNLKISNQKLQDIQNSIIISFADLVESRDMFTGQHIKRTSAYMEVLVHHMANMAKYQDQLTKRQQELMCKAAPLHDIGKIKISDTILNKPGRLSDDEFEKIKLHTVEGGKIINSTLTNIEDQDYLMTTHDMALYHHEKWDGTGYPCHLAGEEIPLCARIMAVVDVFDALTSKRIYKDAFTAGKAFSIMKECSGTQFDESVLSAFFDISEEVEEVLRQHQDASA
ncbi:MAG: substrate-binding domain-containing protein [Lachnospiraceae bacterium]|nr:substrate-binding domain-containing protein [Lachnospiraceae bacterium]